MWRGVFDMVKDVEMNKPLSPKILSKSNQPFVQRLIYIYSMQTFLFKELNKASRNKDVTKIKFYGAFASALSFIVHYGNHKSQQKSELSVFRGL